MDAFKKSLTSHFAHLIKRDFSSIDANGDGEVSFSELIAAAPRLGMNKSDVRSLFKDVDADGDGALSTLEVNAFLGLHGDSDSVNPLLDVTTPSSTLNAQGSAHFVALDVHEPITVRILF